VENKRTEERWLATQHHARCICCFDLNTNPENSQRQCRQKSCFVPLEKTNRGEKRFGRVRSRRAYKVPPPTPDRPPLHAPWKEKKKKGPWWMKTLMMEIYTDPCSVWLFGESSHGVGVFRLVLIQPGGICMCICVSTETLAGTGAAINPLKG
jgi:hypothetical protein